MQRVLSALTAVVLTPPLFLTAAEPPEEPTSARQQARPVENAPAADSAEATVSGREIFMREWIANDPRSHGGDGLGPVFNGSSCVTCHNLGGAGGAGGFDENVNLLSASFAHFQQAEFRNGPNARGPGGGPNRAALEAQRKASLKQLAQQVHPDFAHGDTVVLHRFGTKPSHRSWLQNTFNGMVGQNAAMSFNTIENVGVAEDIFVVETAESFDPVVEEPSFTDDATAITGPIEGSFAQAAQPTPLPPQPVAPPRIAVAQPGPVAVFSGDVLVPQLAEAQVGVGFGNGKKFPILGAISSELGQLQSEVRADTANSFGFQNAVMQTSQRNTTALWGAGLVDRIPEEAIAALAKAQAEKKGRVSGRVHRLPDGRIGRFGWKAQKASLYDFTMAACAVELGLHVPGENQASVPYDRDYEPAGLDLTKREVDALVDYIADLPRPAELKPDHESVAKRLATGEDLFTTVGCAECHVRDVGGVSDVFSDFLLHDMGPSLGSVGSYGVPSVPEPDVPIANADDPVGKAIPPTSREWRTAPLWGVRDSAPYLHDGRARTLEQAIALHGGEAAESRLRFMLLKPEDRGRVIAYLKTLVAPSSVASAE